MKIIYALSFSMLFVIFGFASIFAQSGRKDTQPSPTPSVNVSEKDVSETKPNVQNLEKTRFLIAGNLSYFVEQLNELGKLGYRVDKAFNFGGDGAVSQRFVAVLKLENGNIYEYDWLTSPNKNYLESRLNYRTESGFYPVQSFALTVCSDKTIDSDNDSSSPNSAILRLNKGDIFLLERKKGVTKKTKDYKVFVGKIGVGKNPTDVLQTALETAPKDYRPFKILFNKSGLLDFSVSILLENDLTVETAQKTDYKFVKEVNGFEKEINSLAQTGYKFLSGRRIGLIKYALMAKDSDGSFSYNFIEQNKYEKDLAKNYKQGDVFNGLFIGDSECDSPETIGGKLVFEQNKNVDSKNTEHKYFRLTNGNAVAPTDEAIAEITRLLAENYKLKDIFYSGGLVAIFAK